MDTLSGEMSVTTQNQPQLASSVTSLLYQGDNVPSLALVWYLLFQGEQCDPEERGDKPSLAEVDPCQGGVDSRWNDGNNSQIFSPLNQPILEPQ